MGLSGQQTQTSSTVLLEMPRTPKKRPAAAGSIYYVQKAVIVAAVDDDDDHNSSSRPSPTKVRKLKTEPSTPTAGRNSNPASPRLQQQPYVQHNIDRYFTTQLATSPTTSTTTTIQPPQQCPLDLSVPADVKGIIAAGGNNNSNSNGLTECSGSTPNISHDKKPQKENVPDATPMPAAASLSKGEQRGKRAPAGRTKPAGGASTKTRRPRTQRPKTQHAQQKSNASRGRVTDDEAATAAEDNNDVKRITDYFQVRRSHRKPSGEMIRHRRMVMEEKVLNADETGFQIVKFEEKGRGVVSNVDLKMGDYVLEYAGELIDLKEARRREELYVGDTSVGCYMYYFQHGNTSHCIDATCESNRLGRLINHSIRSANLKTKSTIIGGIPRLVFVAKRDISAGEELLYDYGDRSKESLQSHPWLKN